MYSLIFPISGLLLVNFLGLNLFNTYYQNVDKLPEEICELNIFIFTIFFFNSMNWIIFSLYYNDLWIFLAGVTMPIGSILCILLLYNTISKINKRYIELIFIFAYIYILSLVIIINYTPISIDVKNSIVNYSLLFNIFSFITPLSTIITIIKNKNTKTLYLPFTIINNAASILWLVYGILLNNYFLIAIYSVGILTSLIEIILYMYYNIRNIIKINKHDVIENLDTNVSNIQNLN
jgi:uncharacterized protein with PQ loop repeat